MVAAADLYVHGDVASLNATATLPAYRNRGAQTALITARIKAATDAGCQWLVAETGVPDEGTSSRSLDNNLMRAGLLPRYIRQNWVWRTPGDVGAVRGLPESRAAKLSLWENDIDWRARIPPGRLRDG
jgi:GNAT superfamily N-acetyltransferase